MFYPISKEIGMGGVKKKSYFPSSFTNYSRIHLALF